MPNLYKNVKFLRLIFLPVLQYYLFIALNFLFTSYQILAASAIPSGFVDGKVAAEKLIEALQLDQSEYRVGHTKVFFRAGIVGELEDMRDERLSKIISQFQAYCKGHLMRIEYKKMCDQRYVFSRIHKTDSLSHECSTITVKNLSERI